MESYANVDSSVDRNLDELRRITSLLKLWGVLAFLTTIGTVGLNLYYAVAESQPNNATTMTAALIAVTCLPLLFLMCYEFYQRKGDNLFSEISDELQWYLVERKQPNQKQGERPPLSARTIMREYVNNTGLPFVNGKNRVAIYALLNLLSLFVYVILTSLAR